MSLPAHVYQIYIAATPQQVWVAITESEWTRRYFHTVAFVEPPQQGKPYLTVGVDGRPAVDGITEKKVVRAASSRPGTPATTQSSRGSRLAGWSGPSRTLERG
jgi:hypothetical protein